MSVNLPRLPGNVTSTAKNELLASTPVDAGGRYEIHELLGRGGMACVYRATDLSLSRPVALKQLMLAQGTPGYASAASLFEREFHTLMQLRHPHVIEVYEYGLCTDGSPFYTMELLDGGDLRERSPLAWRDACRLAFDVCSALALLHSRRLLHRDVSPRNIRCTQDGQAKLIDFGAMAPMSTGGSEVVGTPAFTAPETLQRLALDARTDLYSLGASLYFGLTGRLPYPARSFSELLTAWRLKPLPPSALVAGIPAVLDDLVLALLGVEPALRPQSAFAVMQQLAACADLRIEESESVSRAYLSTPSLVGRGGVLSRVRDVLRDARLSRSTGLLLEGPPGAGRSRLLDACVLEAQTRSFTVLRATANGTRESFATARALTEHLLDALPDRPSTAEFAGLFTDASESVRDAPQVRPRLRSFADPDLDPARIQRALRALWTGVSRTHPLLIAVDDAHKIDDPSAALLAEIIDKTRSGGILIALTADSDHGSGAALLALARRCTSLQLTPLDREHSRELLGSLFGDVAHLDMLATEIQRVSHGNAREILELAQHLVDQGTIRYTAGGWTLPNVLSPADLPRSTALALRARSERLSAPARFLAEAQALAYYETFEDGDYHLLSPQLTSTAIELAISELLSAQVLVREDEHYRLAHRMWAAALSDALDAEQTKLRHRALAALYASKKSFAFIHHAFLADMNEEALTALDIRNSMERSEAELMKLLEQNVAKMVWCYPRAIATAQALGRSAREIHDLRRWQYAGTVVCRPEAVDKNSARLWLDQLIHDSGLDLYRADTRNTDSAARLMGALVAAQQRYQNTPEAQRVYKVDEAIRALGQYVVVSLALAGNTLDTQLGASLPGLLEPFASLSPLLEGIWNNAQGAFESYVLCRYEQSLERWRHTLIKLDVLTAQEPYLDAMRNAIAFAIGAAEAQLGLPTTPGLPERLDRDPYQRVAALDLRRIDRLQQGDAAGADRLRRQAEVLALQMRVPPMFKSLLNVELVSYVRIGDLQGVAHVIEQMKPLAAAQPGWQPNLLVAQASFHLVRGDHGAALSQFEQSLELTALDNNGCSRQPGMWLAGQAGRAECLLALGRAEQARAAAAAAVAVCEAQQVVAGAFDLVRTLALAEGRLGHPSAVQRLDALIAAQTQLGVTGLHLGLSYEARARVAIWTGDAAAFERFAELTARAFRHGARTALAARYERLVNDAARAGIRTNIALEEFAVLASGDTSALGTDALSTMITRSMASSRSADERTQLALQMICSAHGTGVGYLYLLTPAGLVLRASRGSEQPASELRDHVTRFMADRREHSDELDEMITGELEQDDTLTSLIRAAGASYQFLSLACVIETVNTLVGVAVVEVSQASVGNEKQTQLLSALAASLLQSGDCEGLQLSAAEPA